VTTTAFFTHCCKNARASLARWLALACLLLGAALPAQADVATDITQMRLERTEEGVFLSANIRFDLPAVVEDALLKGLSMYFVAEADLYRDRWYWYDRKITGAARHMRVSYQPLTRRWRLQVAPGPINNTGLGVTLGQNFDTLEEAMAAVKRISRWKIAEAAEIEPDARHNVDFRFRLDVSQLPRPFQIGAVGQPDWRIAAVRNQRLVVESSP
jgi:hypothetical protein